VIILDTNVLSEPLKARPDERVTRWLRSAPDRFGVTSITIGELLVGASRLGPGRRRERLLAVIELVLAAHGSEVLAYDEAAARRYAVMQEQRRAMGRPLAVEDGMIAAICARNDASLATRTTRDFEGLGIEVVDPWAMPA